jgi:isocitrate dehydrogenase kinase/phosphatase
MTLSTPTMAEAHSPFAQLTATTIKHVFTSYHAEFKAITRRAKGRFEKCDWHGLHTDAEERLDLYKSYVADALRLISEGLGDGATDKVLWISVKEAYKRLISDLDDFDLAQSFYNSVAMRVGISNVAPGLDPSVVFDGSEFESIPPAVGEAVFNSFSKTDGTSGLMREVLSAYPFECGYHDLNKSAALAAEQIDTYLQHTRPGQAVKAIEIAQPVFYRGIVAYLVGRVRTTSHFLPIVIALTNSEQGVWVDAVLLTENEVSIVFSFARSYFLVEVQRPRAMVFFLRSLMPLKPISELYISLGYSKHGKTELYRDLTRHLANSSDKFVIAPGERGMVMIVFTLSSFDVVFKIIKDTFDYPKTTTRKEVMDHYHLVFRHDRCGRLVDAQEFEHLRFDKSRFSPELLDELLSVAAKTVSVDGDSVVIKHLYTERKVVPLNLYVKQVQAESAVEVVTDYGRTIKELAFTNIFPGDILLKNFGVTRHGRVVFYDYDELCFLTDCTFREMPESSDYDDEMSADPWFSVGEMDVFPEELKTFLGLPEPLAAVFFKENGELFDVPFWGDLQARHRAGEVIDIFPYKEERRLEVEG